MNGGATDGGRADGGPAARAAPSIRRIYESALYCDDLEGAAAFFRDVLGLCVISEGPRLVSFAAGDGTHLLLFRRGATVEPLDFAGGRIPAHDGAGPTHLAFAVDAADLPAWEKRLVAAGVAVESRVTWSAGPTSLYFRDPEGHSLELACPGTWGEPNPRP